MADERKPGSIGIRFIKQFDIVPDPAPVRMEWGPDGTVRMWKGPREITKDTDAPPDTPSPPKVV